jgi:transposase
MRTKAKLQRAMWSYVSDEDRIPADHPLRAMRAVVDPILQELSPQFDSLYVAGERASVPPEYLLGTLLLQMLYTIRSERQLVEQLHYNILYRWFVGLRMDDEVWHATTFSKNRERLIKGDIARRFFDAVVAHAQAKKLMSNEHFTVDGTMIEAAASMKSVRPRDEPLDPPAGDRVTKRLIFMAKRERTRRMCRRLIPMHGCIGRVPIPAQSSRISAT